MPLICKCNKYKYPTHANTVVKKSDMIIVDNWVRRRGRPKLILDTIIRKDLCLLNLSKEVVAIGHIAQYKKKERKRFMQPTSIDWDTKLNSGWFGYVLCVYE